MSACLMVECTAASSRCLKVREGGREREEETEEGK